MKVKFFNQPFMLNVGEASKVHGSVHDYLILVLNNPLRDWDEVVMVSKLKKSDYGIITHMEVFP